MKKSNWELMSGCAVALGAGLLLSPPAQADVQINGFANIVFGSTFDKNESTYGYDDSLDFNNESLFALQFTSDLGDGLSATAQMVARGEDNFDPELA